MDRLTRKSQSSEMVWFVDHDNNNLNLEPCEMSYSQNGKAIRKLAYYEDAEEQGRLVVLPCKIGDSVDGKIGNWFGTVEEISINSDGMFLYVASGGYNHLVKPDEVEFR
jgi:hypothetical protein